MSAIAWNPSNANVICSVGKGGNALIWDLSESSSPDEVSPGGGLNERSYGSGHEQRREPKSEYSTGDKIFNVVWSQADPTWVSVSFEEKLQTLRT